MSEPREGDPSMADLIRNDQKLPSGKSCADCFAVRLCVGIGCTTADSTSCDYWPNRFRLPTVLR